MSVQEAHDALREAIRTGIDIDLAITTFEDAIRDDERDNCAPSSYGCRYCHEDE